MYDRHKLTRPTALTPQVTMQVAMTGTTNDLKAARKAIVQATVLKKEPVTADAKAAQKKMVDHLAGTLTTAATDATITEDMIDLTYMPKVGDTPEHFVIRIPAPALDTVLGLQPFNIITHKKETIRFRMEAVEVRAAPYPALEVSLLHQLVGL